MYLCLTPFHIASPHSPIILSVTDSLLPCPETIPYPLITPSEPHWVYTLIEAYCLLLLILAMHLAYHQSRQGGYSLIISDVFSKILSFPFYKYYTMTHRVEQVGQSGPPQELISCITHFHNLLRNLPSSLPSNPAESWYCFGLDTEDVAAEGIWYAFHRNLEACFEQW